jgi:hypothetical protein
MTTPAFVVVGHVNRGKSSVVSTLAADESVRIDAAPGTTKHCRHFPMRVDGQLIYELIDSPGFERPRAVLEWLRARETSTAERRAAVAHFVKEHAGGERFRQECELLAPVLEGAAVLYVVDGSVPFSPSSEAEMEILQWTGRPRMALINMTGADDYTKDWRPVLDQYFRLVRVFNAHRAVFVERVKLVRSLREIHEPWEAALNGAIDALLTERRQNTRDAAAEIAAMLARMLTFVIEKKLLPDADAGRHKDELATRFLDELRRFETRAHRSIEGIYRRAKLVVQHDQLQSQSEDLFSEGTWTRLGLSRNQLAVLGAGTGLLAGGVVDAATVIAFPFATAIGTVSGAAAGYLGAMRLEKVKVLKQPMGGKLLTIGPMRNPNFPWIVLDRALAHHAIIANCPHARRETLDADDDETRQGHVANLPAEQRKPLEKCFASLRKRAGKEADDAVRIELAEHVEAILSEQENLESLG